MPCYDGRENERQVLVNDVDRERLRKEWRHNSPVAELLCYLLKNSPAARNEHCQNNPKLAKWWAEHQERDRRKAKRRG